jgi:hypothetical protein
MRPVCMCVRSAARWRTRRHSSKPRPLDQVGLYLERIRRDEDMATVAVEAFEVVDEPSR